MICFTMVVVGSNHYFMTGVLLDRKILLEPELALAVMHYCCIGVDYYTF